MKHVVMFSFGESSWYAGKLAAAAYGAGNVTLLFADTKTEDEDTYAWGRAAAQNIGAELVEIADGRDIWQLFKDERMIGNTRADICSRVLKREMCDRWVKERYGPDDCILHYGIGLFERERLDKIKRRVAPYQAESLLCQAPYPTQQDIRLAAAEAGLWVQRLYRQGFKHANCGGACVKGGQAQWVNLLKVMPERYAHHEAKEEEMREYLGKDVSVLRDRRGGVSRPLPLRVLRERVESGGQCDLFDWGGCNCFGVE